jgi:hypothetical protein
METIAITAVAAALFDVGTARLRLAKIAPAL